MAVYLEYHPDEKLYPEACLGINDLIQMGKVLAPAFLGTLINDARDFLINEPGPNRIRRMMYVPDWLDYWHDKLRRMSTKPDQNTDRLVPSDRILSLEVLNRRFNELRDQDLKTGIWNMATGEGGPSHREAWNHSLKRIRHVAVLFEQREYFNQHSGRRKPCLPEAMRSSLAIHYGLYVSLAPVKTENLSEAEHYLNVFIKSGADINFTTCGFPHYLDQLNRNPPKYRSIALIVNSIERHTSDTVEKLAPDIELDICPDMELITEK
jgi:hypothetical protein